MYRKFSTLFSLGFQILRGHSVGYVEYAHSCVLMVMGDRSRLTRPRRSSGPWPPEAASSTFSSQRWAWSISCTRPRWPSSWSYLTSPWPGGASLPCPPNFVCIPTYSLRNGFLPLWFLKHIAGLRSLHCLKRELQILLSIWHMKFLHILSEACTRITSSSLYSSWP